MLWNVSWRERSWRDQVVALVSWDRNEANVLTILSLGGNFSQQGYTCQWIPCTLPPKNPLFQTAESVGSKQQLPISPKLRSLEMDKLSMPESYSPMTRAASCPICWCDSIMTSAQVMFFSILEEKKYGSWKTRKGKNYLNIEHWGYIWSMLWSMCSQNVVYVAAQLLRHS